MRPVSYTHLDVYKRQEKECVCVCLCVNRVHQSTQTGLEYASYLKFYFPYSVKLSTNYVEIAFPDKSQTEATL